jgi:phosphate-selective porin
MRFGRVVMIVQQRLRRCEYASFSYFLTGENRAYCQGLKVLDRVQPVEPFFWTNSCNGSSCGWALGKSQRGTRLLTSIKATTLYYRTEQFDGQLRGFNNGFVIGVNWHQNAWSPMFFDYERELVDFVDNNVPNTQANIFGVRWQIDW